VASWGQIRGNKIKRITSWKHLESTIRARKEHLYHWSCITVVEICSIRHRLNSPFNSGMTCGLSIHTSALNYNISICVIMHHLVTCPRRFWNSYTSKFLFKFITIAEIIGFSSPLGLPWYFIGSWLSISGLLLLVRLSPGPFAHVLSLLPHAKRTTERLIVGLHLIDFLVLHHCFVSDWDWSPGE